MCIVPPVYVKYYAKHFIHGTSFNPHKTLMRQYDYYPHFIEKETRSEKGRNLFKVVPLVSSGVGIWMQVFLRPTPNNIFGDVTGLKKSELGSFPSTTDTYLKIRQRKETQPPASVLLPELWSPRDPGNQMKRPRKMKVLISPMTLLSWKRCF